MSFSKRARRWHLMFTATDAHLLQDNMYLRAYIPDRLPSATRRYLASTVYLFLWLKHISLLQYFVSAAVVLWWMDRVFFNPRTYFFNSGINSSFIKVVMIILNPMVCASSITVLPISCHTCSHTRFRLIGNFDLVIPQPNSLEANYALETSKTSNHMLYDNITAS